MTRPSAPQPVDLASSEPKTSAAVTPARSIEIVSGAPFEVPQRAIPWQIEHGRLEAYLVWPEGRRLIGVFEDGDTVFALNSDSALKLLLVTDGEVRMVKADQDSAAMASAGDKWVMSSTIGLPKCPHPVVCDTAADDVDVQVGDCLSGSYHVRWVRPVGALELEVLGAGATIKAPSVYPVTDRLWCEAKTPGTASLRSTEDLGLGPIPAAVAGFMDTLPILFDQIRDDRDASDLVRLSDIPEADQPTDRSAERAIIGLSKVLGHEANTLSRVSPDTDLQSLARLAGLRSRKVILTEDWHRRDHGPLLVTVEGTDEVEALHWIGAAYRTTDGQTVDQAFANHVATHAYGVSVPLPETVSGLWSLAKFVISQGNRRDALVAGLAALLVSCLGILFPLGTGWLLSDVVPSGALGLLIAVGIALACTTMINAASSTARAIAIHRIDGRGASILNAALTDRLLRLPTTFFKSFSAGDLNQRLENVEQMRALAVGILLSSGLTTALSIIYLAVLFTYDTRLALIAMALVTVYIIAVALARVLQMEAIREAAAIDGEIASLTYETLEGIGKLRAAAAEPRAMERWLDVYRRERAAAMRAGRVSVHFSAFADAYQTITLVMLFAGAGALAAADAPTGVFIGFLAAFGSFQAAFIGLSEALLQIYSAQPLVDRAKPVLTAKAELSSGGSDPGQLQGLIECSGLTFSYESTLPPVLHNLEFRVGPGEHLAIVGGSGSGKSTLLRLLLGFERPQRGSILYDGQDIGSLDVLRVRAQIGAVLQASSLFSGSILENIRGAGSASLERCLAAAEHAGLTPDLEYFAMGLHTPITEGANTLSGGQRQRILIARALAADPRILLFDEATSALDNATQAVVSETLDALKITRITIAHRLSTVRNADRICVLEGGCFVEQGTYQDLIARNGAFARLAQRQLTGD